MKESAMRHERTLTTPKSRAVQPVTRRASRKMRRGRGNAGLRPRRKRVFGGRL
jgi:hypothetical protein